MRNYLFLFIIIFISCNSEEVMDDMVNEGMDDTVCGVMNPIGFSVTPLDKSVNLQFGSIGHWDGPFRSCSPEAYDLYMLEDEEFRKLTHVEGSAGSYLVENLQNEKTYSFRVTALHSELDPYISEVRTVKVGLLPLPQFIDNPLGHLGINFELFMLGPDGDKFLTRSSSDDWFLSSFSNTSQREKVVDDSFLAKWNPQNNNEIIYRAKQYVQIASNTNGVTSKSISTINLENGTEELLHDISEHMDFGSEHKPEQYWIHDFNYSLDALSVYFESNKDNGSSSLFEKKVFNNIWQLDLNTKDIQQVTDFLPMNFEMKSFVEDPKAPGNFYILGGIEGEVVEIEGAIFNPDKVDIYYFNTKDQSLSLVLETIYEEEFLDINPSGDKLLIINSSSGREELWSYDLVSDALTQITQSEEYRYTKHRYYPNWITDTEFMASVIHEDVLKLAVFKI